MSGMLRLGGLLLASLLIAGCGQTVTPAVPAAPTLSADQLADLNIVTGQLVFVPAYSEIVSDSSPNLRLSTTLAVHNTDTDDTIIIRSVRYYDTDGDLVREFIDTPIQLQPLATAGFFVPTDDTTGGWGANFLVEWVAEKPVYEPVIEAVMVSSRGTEGVSFISPGRVISEQQP
ncbi:MAG: DUF3124 domain-containing protein [Chloroflexi bacterium]|nr:DUF3124 domain-containing protein [Chloroflexota bacterium]